MPPRGSAYYTTLLVAGLMRFPRTSKYYFIGMGSEKQRQRREQESQEEKKGNKDERESCGVWEEKRLIAFEY